MLIDLLENIFLNNGYQFIQIEQNLSGFNSSLFIPKDFYAREEYFLVVEAIQPSEESTRFVLDEGADAFFEAIRSNQSIGNAFSKNCTMILCCNAGYISRELMLSVEEDHYNFKKNVIAYTIKEIQDLRAKLEASGHGKLTSSSINKAINSGSGDAFTKFKGLGEEADNYYSLLMKIVIKLPFIKYEPARQQLDDLERSIRTGLTPEENEILEKLEILGGGISDEGLSKVLIDIWGGEQ